MAKTAHNPEGLPAPVGPYSHVTTAAPGGRLVFCAGQVGWGADGELVGPGDVVAQAEQTMRNLGRCLQHAGATFADVTKITMFMVDVRDFPKVARVRERYLTEPFPASTLVEVTALIDPELLIEIEATAVVHEQQAS